MILVIGGRSKVGRAVIDELVARGETVRAMVRNPAADWVPGGVEVVTGDLEDLRSLRSAVAGVDRPLLLCGPSERSGVPFAIVRPNSFTQNVVETMIPSIAADGRLDTGMGRARSSMVDARDVGSVAARLPSETRRAGRINDVTGEGVVVELFGDYRRSGADGYAASVSDTVERLTGRPPRSPGELLADQLPAGGAMVEAVA
jgi:uncharacterized protein YbjT (DUF2867 family)